MQVKILRFRFYHYHHRRHDDYRRAITTIPFISYINTPCLASVSAALFAAMLGAHGQTAVDIADGLMPFTRDKADGDRLRTSISGL